MEAGTSLLHKNFTLMDVKRVVNLLDSELQGLEETFQHHPSLCFFSFLEMQKNKCTVLPETVSISTLFRHRKRQSKATGKKRQACGAD